MIKPGAGRSFGFIASWLLLPVLSRAAGWTQVTINAGFSGDDKAVADIDLDGRPDVIGGTSTANSPQALRWWRQESPLSWTETVIVSGGSHNFSTEMQAADMDGDGDPDLVVFDDGHGVGYWRNPKNPGGDPGQPAHWSWRSIGDGGGFVHNLFVGDVNKDGRLDVTTKVGYGGSARIFIQNPAGDFTALSLLGSSGGEGNCLGDLDNDGDLDIVTAVGVSPYVKWFENDGSGGGWTPHDGPNPGNGDLCLRVADINGDGRNELVVSHSEACGSVKFFSTADPRAGPWSVKDIDGTSGCGWHTLQVGDVNNDGRPDLLSAQMHAAIMVFYNPGGAALASWTSEQVAVCGLHNGVLADVDRNGALDIVGCNYDGDSPVGLWYWRNGSPVPGPSPHAIADLDGDGAAEAAVDFGTAGAWIWNGGAWSQLTGTDPENLTAADIDGNQSAGILADLGYSGLWLWNGGAWNQLSGLNADGVAAGDTDADGRDEVIGDFFTFGLWRLNGGGWSQLSGADADGATAAELDSSGSGEVIGDFGALGLWIHDGASWSQLSRLNPDLIIPGKAAGGNDLIGDFGPAGLWRWSAGGGWTSLSGADADFLRAAGTDGDTDDEIAADFGVLGLWLWNAGGWSQLSGANAEAMNRADLDGDGTDELAVDFGSLGLWIKSFSGGWSQAASSNPEWLGAGDFDGDQADEILADFGMLGLWLWDAGSWIKISALNPD